jgi:hypothetical protein
MLQALSSQSTGRDNNEILINVTSVVITSLQEETTTRFLLMYCKANSIFQQQKRYNFKIPK